MIWSTLSCSTQTFGSTLMTHWAGRWEAMWVTISQGKDSRRLGSGEGELRSEWSSGGLEDTPSPQLIFLQNAPIPIITGDPRTPAEPSRMLHCPTAGLLHPARRQLLQLFRAVFRGQTWSLPETSSSHCHRIKKYGIPQNISPVGFTSRLSLVP